VLVNALVAKERLSPFKQKVSKNLLASPIHIPTAMKTLQQFSGLGLSLLFALQHDAPSFNRLILIDCLVVSVILLSKTVPKTLELK
jgi:hypothetical protein